MPPAQTDTDMFALAASLALSLTQRDSTTTTEEEGEPPSKRRKENHSPQRAFLRGARQQPLTALRALCGVADSLGGILSPLETALKAAGASDVTETENEKEREARAKELAKTLMQARASVVPAWLSRTIAAAVTAAALPGPLSTGGTAEGEMMNETNETERLCKALLPAQCRALALLTVAQAQQQQQPALLRQYVRCASDTAEAAAWLALAVVVAAEAEAMETHRMPGDVMLAVLRDARLPPASASGGARVLKALAAYRVCVRPLQELLSVPLLASSDDLGLALARHGLVAGWIRGELGDEGGDGGARVARALANVAQNGSHRGLLFVRELLLLACGESAAEEPTRAAVAADALDQYLAVALGGLGAAWGSAAADALRPWQTSSAGEHAATGGTHRSTGVALEAVAAASSAARAVAGAVNERQAQEATMEDVDAIATAAARVVAESLQGMVLALVLGAQERHRHSLQRASAATVAIVVEGADAAGAAGLLQGLAEVLFAQGRRRAASALLEASARHAPFSVLAALLPRLRDVAKHEEYGGTTAALAPLLATRIEARTAAELEGAPLTEVDVDAIAASMDALAASGPFSECTEATIAQLCHTLRVVLLAARAQNNGGTTPLVQALGNAILRLPATPAMSCPPLFSAMFDAVLSSGSPANHGQSGDEFRLLGQSLPAPTASSAHVGALGGTVRPSNDDAGSNGNAAAALHSSVVWLLKEACEIAKGTSALCSALGSALTPESAPPTAPQYLECFPRKSPYPFDHEVWQKFEEAPVLWDILLVAVKDENAFLAHCYEVFVSLISSVAAQWNIYSKFANTSSKKAVALKDSAERYSVYLFDIARQIQVLPPGWDRAIEAVAKVPPLHNASLLRVVMVCADTVKTARAVGKEADWQPPVVAPYDRTLKEVLLANIDTCGHIFAEIFSREKDTA